MFKNATNNGEKASEILKMFEHPYTFFRIFFILFDVSTRNVFNDKYAHAIKILG